MHRPEDYRNGNLMQRNDAQKITSSRFAFNDGESILDIGFGSADVFMDFIYPKLPSGFGQIVGIDEAQEMVNYAQHHYSDDKRISFRQEDISSENFSEDLKQKFDHVTSLYCLNWVQNQRQALKNIYAALRGEGSDVLLAFIASIPTYDIYEELSKLPQFEQYMKDYEQYISPYHRSKDAADEYRSLLLEVGFKNAHVELRNEKYYYESDEVLKTNVNAICPFVDSMPENVKEDFLNAYVQSVNNRKLYEVDGAQKKYVAPYSLMVVHARK